MQSSLPDQGIEPALPALKDKQLTAGLPSKSQETSLYEHFTLGAKKTKSKNVQN